MDSIISLLGWIGVGAIYLVILLVCMYYGGKGKVRHRDDRIDDKPKKVKW